MRHFVWIALLGVVMSFVAGCGSKAEADKQNLAEEEHLRQSSELAE